MNSSSFLAIIGGGDLAVVLLIMPNRTPSRPPKAPFNLRSRLAAGYQLTQSFMALSSRELLARFSNSLPGTKTEDLPKRTDLYFLS